MNQPEREASPRRSYEQQSCEPAPQLSAPSTRTQQRKQTPNLLKLIVSEQKLFLVVK